MTPDLDEAPAPQPAPRPTPRLTPRSASPPRSSRSRIARVVVEPHGPLGLRSTVELAGSDHSGRASVEAAATPIAEVRAVARATVAVAEQFLRGRAKLEVESVRVAGDRDGEVVTVTVTLLTEAGEERLVGAALVRDSARDTAARAALDAINRRVEYLARHRR